MEMVRDGLNRALRRSFSTVKKDMNELRNENKKQEKLTNNLKEENNSLKRKLSELKNDTVHIEEYEFVERRLDDLEEEIFDLEENKLDRKSFNSSIEKLNKKLRERGNIAERLNELDNIIDNIERLNKLVKEINSIKHLQKSVSRLEKENKTLLPKKAFKEQLRNIKEAKEAVFDIKDTLDIIDLKYDDMGEVMNDTIGTKEMMRIRNKIYARLKALENGQTKKKSGPKKPEKSRFKKFWESLEEFFQEEPEVPEPKK